MAAAPDIVALAALGVETAWRLTVSIQSTATLRLGPTATPAADGGSAPVTWAKELAGKKVIKYDEKVSDKDGGSAMEERGTQTRNMRTVILVKANDTEGVIPTPDAQIAIGADTWEVYEVERVPGDPLYILYVR